MFCDTPTRNDNTSLEQSFAFQRCLAQLRLVNETLRPQVAVKHDLCVVPRLAARRYRVLFPIKSLQFLLTYSFQPQSTQPLTEMYQECS
jgi:hypothetical protein